MKVLFHGNNPLHPPKGNIALVLYEGVHEWVTIGFYGDSGVVEGVISKSNEWEAVDCETIEGWDERAYSRLGRPVEAKGWLRRVRRTETSASFAAYCLGMENPKRATTVDVFNFCKGNVK